MATRSLAMRSNRGLSKLICIDGVRGGRGVDGGTCMPVGSRLLIGSLAVSTAVFEFERPISRRGSVSWLAVARTLSPEI